MRFGQSAFVLAARDGSLRFLLFECYFELFWGSHREHGMGAGAQGLCRVHFDTVIELGSSEVETGLTYSCDHLARSCGRWDV